MRLKQLLGILLPLVVITATAAAGSQLTGVGVATGDQATTLTLQTTGDFTHSEYRPTQNLMLVDLTGVSAARMDDRTQTVNLPGVVSYRVVGYKGANDTDVARVELTLAPGANVGVKQNQNALILRVTGAAAAKAAVPTSLRSNGTRPATVQRVNVVRGKNGIDVEVVGNGVLEAKTMRLSHPERLVVDVANAEPLLRHHVISVNTAEVKAVRMSRYQSAPPVTRIVMDLGSAREYEVVPAGNKLIVKLHSASKPAPEVATSGVAAVPASTPEPPAAAKVESKTLEAKANDIVIVQPTYRTVSATGSTPAPQPANVRLERAGVAAAKFGPDSANPELSLSPTSASLSPLASKLNFQQQAAPAAQGSPVMRPRYTGEPISVNLKDVDLKDFFRLIHEISGLNVVLDPNVRGTLTIVLDDVPWDQALDIVLKNNGLDRQLDGNVLRIATVDTLRKEAEARRAQVEAQALAVDKVTVTRFLSYAHAKDIVPTIKKFLSQRGDVVADDRTNSLIIDDIPSSIPRVDELLAKLDRKTQEVEIEARVVAATRSFARDIGVQLGFGWGNGPSAVGGAGSVGVSPLATPPGQFIVIGDPTQPGQLPIPLFSNLPAVGPTSGISFVNHSSNMRLDAILTMAESRGLLKILSRPRVVTQNNIQALVRQGVRIPIVTQAQLGGPPTVTYVDAFLRLTVTPQITAENTIFLNVDVENTVPDFGRTIQGNPTLVTQQATTQVLVTDGGTVVIGGVIQTQNSVNVKQVPLLGDIPILGNLFKNRAVTTETQELIFFITPKIIQT